MLRLSPAVSRQNEPFLCSINIGQCIGHAGHSRPALADMRDDVRGDWVDARQLEAEAAVEHVSTSVRCLVHDAEDESMKHALAVANWC